MPNKNPIAPPYGQKRKTAWENPRHYSVMTEYGQRNSIGQFQQSAKQSARRLILKKGLLEQIGRKQEGNAICRLLLEYASRKISKSAPAEGSTCDFSVASTLPCAKLPAIFWIWIVSRRKCSLGWESGRLCAHNRGSQGTRQDGAGWRIGRLELGQRKSEHEFDLQRMCFVTEDALLLCHIAFEISSVPVRLLTKT